MIYCYFQVNREGTLLLTSSPWRAPYSRLWSLGEFFEPKLTFKDDDYVEFSKINQVNWTISFFNKLLNNFGLK